MKTWRGKGGKGQHSLWEQRGAGLRPAPHHVLLWSKTLLHGVKMGHRGNVENAIGGGGSRADRMAKVQGAEDVLFLARGKNVKTPAACAKIDFAVGDQGRGPNFAFNFVRPTGFAGLGIHTMERAPTIGDEDQPLADRGRGQHMFLQRIRPDQAGGRDVAGSGGVEALEPRLVLTPPDVPASGNVDAVVVEDGKAVEVTRAFTTVAVVLVNVCLRRSGVEVELPDFREEGGGGEWRSDGVME